MSRRDGFGLRVTRQPSNPPPDARIIQIREFEDRIARMKEAVSETNHLAAVADWEIKSGEKAKQTTIKQRLEALKSRRAATIDARRQKLASKLHREDLALKQELINSQETPEQRRAKLGQRAREMAAAREAERAKLAEELTARAFAENCDPLRDAISRKKLFYTVEDRNQQILDKQAFRLLELEETKMFDEMNELERLKKEQRYIDDQRKAKEARAELSRGLDDQMRAVEERKKEEARLRQEEVAELKALWEKMLKEQEAADAAERERMRRLAEDVKEFNKIKQMELTEAERMERELDLKYLQEALAREAAEEAYEAQLRDARREEMRRYRAHLEAMMQKDAEDTAERDRLINEAFMAQQAKYDAEQAVREAARKKLMEEVDFIRKQQIAHHLDAKRSAAEEMLNERQRIDQEDAEMAAAEAQHKADQLRKALMQQLDIKTQMVAKAHQRTMAAEEKFREAEVYQDQEAMYQGKVTEALKAEPAKYYGRKKVDWFY